MQLGNVFHMQIRRSKWLLFYLGFIHSVMLITLLYLAISPVWFALGTAILLFSFIYSCRQYQWMKNTIAVNYIKRDENGLWQLDYLNGKTQSALKLQHSFVSVNLVIIYLKSSTRWRCLSIVILSDAVDKNLFRQLRVYLKDPKIFLQ
jgi:predicted signal transduction protein with EAL and GGDEF domain